MEKFLGRVITDDTFRHAANQSFDKACVSEGFLFTGEERQALNRLDYTLIERLSIRIDGGIKRGGSFVDFGGGAPVPASGEEDQQ